MSDALAASDSMRWLFAGAGNMAASIVGGLRAAGRPADSLMMIDPSVAARDAALERFGVAVAQSVSEAVATQPDWFDGARIGVVLAVKPGVVDAVCGELLASGLAPDCAVVSIAAGVRIAAIEHALGGAAAVVRCMPNTPALIGLGASALYANDRCDAIVRDEARAMFASVGSVVDVASEPDLDAVTAVSGSGPAYVFRLVELMAEAGASLGLPADMARALAIRTAEGAAAMLAAGDDSPGTLREKVTSPNGTTAAALARFESDGFADTVHAAMSAARDRAVQLGDELQPANPQRQTSS